LPSGRAACAPALRSVRIPVTSSITIPLSRDTSQEVCPWNVSFARSVREPAFAARDVLAGKEARVLAEEILAMDDDAYRTAFKGSAMKRAKLAGLRRNASVVLENAS
jgi:epoxyqueuosine reductase QueG